MERDCYSTPPMSPGVASRGTSDDLIAEAELRELPDINLPADATPATAARTDSRQAAADAGAKLSALKALSGVSAIVSKSRQVDAQALTEIRQHRARVRTPPHSHPTPDGALFDGPTTSGREVRRNTAPLPNYCVPPATPPMSGVQRGGNGAGPGPRHYTHPQHPQHPQQRGTMPRHAFGAMLSPGLPPTNPHAYADWLSHRSLAELLALQLALHAELEVQLSAAQAPPQLQPYSTSPLAAAQAQLMQQAAAQEEHARSLNHAFSLASGRESGTIAQLPSFLSPRADDTRSPFGVGHHPSMPSTPDHMVAPSGAGGLGSNTGRGGTPDFPDPVYIPQHPYTSFLETHVARPHLSLAPSFGNPAPVGQLPHLGSPRPSSGGGSQFGAIGECNGVPCSPTSQLSHLASSQTTSTVSSMGGAEGSSDVPFRFSSLHVSP